MKKLFIYWVPVIIYAWLIYIISSLPFTNLPEIKINYLDKLLHLLEYAVLAGLIYRAGINTLTGWLSKHFMLVSIVSTVIYGFLNEFHQAFIPGRTMCVSDFLFDSAGAIIGTFATTRLIHFRRFK